MKYLVVGLGNIGVEYSNTRHNIGFKILDAIAIASNIAFKDKRHAFRAEYKFKSRTFILIKPSTYVNLSGKAVNYWLQKEKIPIENLLIILDDLSLPFGLLRLKQKGGDAGHNGLKSINQILGHQNYSRLRFGIGNNYNRGTQSDYVLNQWSEEEENRIGEYINIAIDIIKNFGTIGIERTMNQYNKY
ncbi:MAG: aminoacyl-tRNA hydrolase [Bacteroidales bacterium]|nr:aminoacyl-tRNA hydrolase [Bacteroidales bacterium]